MNICAHDVSITVFHHFQYTLTWRIAYIDKIKLQYNNKN